VYWYGSYQWTEAKLGVGTPEYSLLIEHEFEHEFVSYEEGCRRGLHYFSAIEPDARVEKEKALKAMNEELKNDPKDRIGYRHPEWMEYYEELAEDPEGDDIVFGS
jgi:hypothetical protein